MSEFFFNNVAGRPAILLKKRLWHRCFHVNFAKFLRAPFYTKHLRWLLLFLFTLYFNTFVYNLFIYQVRFALILQTFFHCLADDSERKGKLAVGYFGTIAHRQKKRKGRNFYECLETKENQVLLLSLKTLYVGMYIQKKQTS